MRFLNILFILFYSQISFGQENEVENFLNDIFHDSTFYSYSDYLHDSTELAKREFFAQTCPSCLALECRLLASKIDSSLAPFRIENGITYTHCERLVIVTLDKKGRNCSNYLKESNLMDILTSDSLLNYRSKFNSEDSILNLKEYKNQIKTFNLNKSDFKCETISAKKIRKFNWDWKQFYGIYGGIYFNCNLPIFNQKQDFAYFTFTINTYGVGKQHIGIYEKTNGKWHPIVVTEGLISTNNWR